MITLPIALGFERNAAEMKKSTMLYIYFGLIFVLFFDLWVENSEQAKNFFGNWIKPITDEPKFSLVWTILAVVAIFIMFKYILDTKEEEKKELEKTLESEMGILIMANKELSNYRLQDNLMSILNRFVHQNSYVNAVQWYQYVENNYQGQTKIKINFQYGAVSEEINLNAIQQLYHYCDTSILRKFRKVKQAYTNGDADPLVDFIIDVHKIIAHKSEESLTQEDAVLCSLMLLSFEILERDFGITFEDFSETNVNLFQRLIDNNRTGIFRAALMEDEYYTFTHTRDNEKFNRQYVARLVKIRDENIVFTIVLDASVLDELEYKKVMLNIATDFETLLKELEGMYNRSREGVGD